MFRKKDKRASVGGAPSPPLQQQQQQQHQGRHASHPSLSSSSSRPSQLATHQPSSSFGGHGLPSPELPLDSSSSSNSRARRGSFFGFGGSSSSSKKGSAPSGAADADSSGGGGGGGGLMGGLLGRTTSRFSLADHPSQPQGREPSGVGSGAGADGRPAGGGKGASSLGVREEYASSFGSSLPSTPHPPTPPPPASITGGAGASGLGATATAASRGQSPAQARAAQDGLQHAIHLLTTVQPDKVYRTSPPTVRSLQFSGVDGKPPRAGRPGTAGNDWRETWLELRGVVLHMWDMQRVRELNAEGKDEHPTRINITDAFVDVCKPLPPTEHAKSLGDYADHKFVFSVSSAGLNSMLFSCESAAERDAYICAIRLAGYEHARLQEVYTGHLLRSSLSAPLPAQITADRPILSGWFDVRSFGARAWTHLWVVLSVASPAHEAALARADAERAAQEAAAAAGSAKSRKRLSNMVNWGGGGGSKDKDHSATTTPYPPVPGDGSPTTADFGGVGAALSTAPSVKASFYLTPPGAARASQSTDRRASLSQPQAPAPQEAPVLVLDALYSAYAVFPEAEAAIAHSGMFKLEGRMRGDALGAVGRKREDGWCLMIPGRKEEGDGWVSEGKDEMIRWLAAFHDAFQLYGRPQTYTWDPRDPRSLFFGHPGGPSEPALFLADAATDPQEIGVSSLGFVRGRMRELLARKMGVDLQELAPAPLQQHEHQQQQQQRQSLHQPPPPARSLDRPPSGQAFNGNVPPTRNGQSVDLGRQVSASSPPPAQQQQQLYQQGGQHAGAPPAADGQGGFQLPPLAFNREEKPLPRTGATPDGLHPPPAQQQAFSSLPPQQQQQAFVEPTLDTFPPSTAEHTPRLGAAAPVLAAPDTPRAAAAVPPPTRESTLSSGGMSSLPGSAGTAVLSQLLVSRQNAVDDPRDAAAGRREGADDNAGEYAYDYTPSDAQTPESEYSQASTGAPPASTAAPSVNVRESLTEEPAEVEEDGLFGGDVPAHLIETGLPVEVVPAPSATQGALSPISSSSNPSGRKKELVPLGRRPSGARAAPPRRVPSGSTASMPAFSDEEIDHDGAQPATPPQRAFGLPQAASSPGQDSHAADALAALSYLEVSASPPTAMRNLPAPPVQSSSLRSSDDKRLSLPKITTDFDASGAANREQQPQQQPPLQQYPSSFGPGKTAAERRAKLEAAERERQAALHKPGARSKAKVTNKPSRTGGWQSSDEDEEEEEEEESVDEHKGDRHLSSQPVPEQPAAVRPLPRNPPAVQPPQPSHSPSQSDLQPPHPEYAQSNGGGGSYSAGGGQARPASNITVNNGRHTLPDNTLRTSLHQQVIQPQPRLAGAGGLQAARSTMWNTHLEAPHGGQPAPEDPNGKFVTLEPASATLTKAFNPNGLLQAGMADRDERSAKRQEELARAEGSSLVNVPPPPPPPQMGLLGAITGYEAQRSREGGVGAALTERDRERREADERARKADSLQRAQMEQMSQQGGAGAYGFPYGQQQQPGLMPGMMPPWGMGWGMQPPMSSYGAFDPQAQMIAQQAAQMAYQQAMMSYSQAGSQMGSPSMGWNGGGSVMGGAAGMPPYWGMGVPPQMSPPMAQPMSAVPFLPPPQSYPTSRAGSVFGQNGGAGGPSSEYNGNGNGNGASVSGGGRHASPVPSRGRSPHHAASMSSSNLDVRSSTQSHQQQQSSRTSTPRSQSKADSQQ